MSKYNQYPVINPFNWGYNGTVKHRVGSNGCSTLVLKDSKEHIKLENFINQYVPDLKDGGNFKLNPLLFTGIMQTMYLSMADFSKRFPVFYGREIMKFSDGGVCTADWVKPEWKTKYKYDDLTGKLDKKNFDKDEVETHPDNWPRLHPRTRYMSKEEIATVHEDERPLIVVLHGLAGGSHEPIIRSLTENLSRISNNRFQVVVLNTRGCARSKITTRALFTAFQTIDIEEFLAREKARHPNRKMYAIGCSFGATLLANYLGFAGDKTPLTAAAVLCNPWDMVLSAHKMGEDFWSKNLFCQAITQFLTRMVKVNMEELEVPDDSKPDHEPTVENPCYYKFTRANLAKAQKLKMVADFDALYTAPCLGFNSALDYYRAASSVNRFEGVKIPLLSINSKDDPVVGEETIPQASIENNPNVLVIETDLGGHLTYMQSNGESWVTLELAKFINAIDEHIL